MDTSTNNDNKFQAPEGKPSGLAHYLVHEISDLNEGLFMDQSAADELENTLDEMEWNDYNDVGKMEFVEFPPVVPASKLEMNKMYKIVAIRKVRNDAVSIINYSCNF